VLGLKLEILGGWVVVEGLKKLAKSWVVVVGVRGQCGSGDENRLRDFDGLFIPVKVQRP